MKRFGIAVSATDPELDSDVDYLAQQLERWGLMATKPHALLELKLEVGPTSLMTSLASQRKILQAIRYVAQHLPCKPDYEVSLRWVNVLVLYSVNAERRELLDRVAWLLFLWQAYEEPNQDSFTKLWASPWLVKRQTPRDLNRTPRVLPAHSTVVSQQLKLPKHTVSSIQPPPDKPKEARRGG